MTLDSLTSINLAYGRGRLARIGADAETQDDLRLDITKAGYKDQYLAGFRDQMLQEEEHDRRLK